MHQNLEDLTEKVPKKYPENAPEFIGLGLFNLLGHGVWLGQVSGVACLESA